MGGAVVAVSAPKPVCVEVLPGMPAKTLVGKAKFGWLKTLKNCPSKRNLNARSKQTIW